MLNKDKEENRRRYYQKYRERILQQEREYRQRPGVRERINAKYYQKHKDRLLAKHKEYLNRPEIKRKRKLYMTNYQLVYGRERRKREKKKQVIIAITKKKFGSAKNYWCVLCEPKQSAIQWHHYTKPYETDKAIPLCKFHHSNIHFGG